MDGQCSAFAETNPDISGVGVRVSFYLQTFLLVILVDRSWEDAPIALWTFIATSFGLMIASIANRDQLSFFQALQVSNLVWLANFGTFVALASYSRQKAASDGDRNGRRKSDYGVKFGAMMQTVLSMALTLYMWSHADTFGTMPDCSHLISYVLFVIKVPALGAGKIVGLTISSLLTTGYIVITIHELSSSYRSRHAKNHRTMKSRMTSDAKAAHSPLTPTSPTLPGPLYSVFNPHSRVRGPTITLVGTNQVSGLLATRPTNSTKMEPLSIPPINPSPSASFQSSPMSIRTTNGTLSSRYRPQRRRWSSDLDPMLIGIIICQIVVFTYFILSSELLLRYNNADSTDEFEFGQILALIVVLPSLLSVIGALKEHGLKPLSARKKNRRRQHRKRSEPTKISRKEERLVAADEIV